MIKELKKTTWILVPGIALLALLLTPVVHAQPIESIPLAPDSIRSASGFIDILQSFILWLGIILGGIAIFALFYSGFLFMTAGSNDSRLTSAKAWLKWGIIGIVVAIFATAVVPLVFSVLEGGFF